MPCRHYLVAGRVQGVSFRNFTAKRALSLGLCGWVRNLRDGRVEILASGPDDKLKEFEDALARGPILARVDSIEKRLTIWDVRELDFQIHEDGETPWQSHH